MIYHTLCTLYITTILHIGVQHLYFRKVFKPCILMIIMKIMLADEGHPWGEVKEHPWDDLNVGHPWDD